MLSTPCGFYSGCGFTKVTHDVFILPMYTIWHHRVLVGGLKVTYSYQVLKNGLEDVTNDVRDCPGGGPCYVLVYVGLEAGLVTQSKDSLFCPQQKWTFHLFLHSDSADF